MTTQRTPALDSETMQLIPEELRGAFMKDSKDQREIRSALDMFERMKEDQAFMEKVRSTSALYPLFKENIFRFLSPNGRLNLDIPLYNVKGAIERLDKCQRTIIASNRAVAEVGDGQVQVSQKENGDPIFLRYDSKAIYQHALRAYERINEIWYQITKLVDETQTLQYFGLSDERRELMNQYGKIIREVEASSDPEGQNLVMNMFVYARSTVRMQPLARLIRNVYP